MAKKSTPLNTKVEVKVKCSCKGICRDKKEKVLNNFKTEFCNESLSILSYTKLENV